MSKVLSFAKLDFITVKPYLTLKNMLIFIAVAVIMSYGSGNSSSSIGIFTAYGCLYVSYPFAVGEKNGIDGLYAALSISRKNVVTGRYFFAQCVNVISAVMAYAVSFAAYIFFGKSFNHAESLVILAAVLFIFAAVQTIQLPLYFKLGYTKAKLLAYLPFVTLPLLVIVFNSVFKDYDTTRLLALIEWAQANPVMLAVLCVLFLCAAFWISYRVSLHYYKKRDF